MSNPDTKEIAFIEWLNGLIIDRGAMAILRRGLGKPPGTVHQMDRYILKFFSDKLEDSEYSRYYLIASLFAFWYQGKDEPVSDSPPDLGASLRSLVDIESDNNNRDDIEKRHEKRFAALLNCHKDEMPEHLRHIISLLKSKNIAINWAQLLCDLRGWDREDHSVQRTWARSFWIAQPPLEPVNQQITNKKE